MNHLLKKIIVFILTLEARLVLKKYKPRVAAITGSVGKTSTKDAVREVLSEAFLVRASEKSFNSEIGIPLTILGMPNAWHNPLRWMENIARGFSLLLWRHSYPEWLVLEVGLERPGDIASAARWLPVDVLIITKFAPVPVHVEFFPSPAALFEEKASLIGALKKEGVLVLNRDDERVYALRERSKSQVLTFGFSPEADVWASHDEVDSDGGEGVTGIAFKLNIAGNALPVRLAETIGRQYISSALAAALVGAHLKLNLIGIIESLSRFHPPPGRMRMLPGVKHTTLIDDTYNASPVAVEAALDALKGMRKAKRRVCVLGDMLELGKFSVEEHKRVGILAGRSCDILLSVGVRARAMAQGALLGGLSEKNVFQFDGAGEAGTFLEGIMNEGDVVLIKGSQGVRMERIVEEVMAEPARSGELLARQEEEWKRR